MQNRRKILLEIGNRIRDKRKRKNISQEKLADMSGLDRSYLGAVERGERNIGVITLLKITQALEIKMEEILSDLDG